jgi:hypothetical protein
MRAGGVARQDKPGAVDEQRCDETKRHQQRIEIVAAGHQEDRRRTLVEVSQQNSGAVHEWYAGRAEPLQRALDRLTRAERQGLIKSLAVMGEELARARTR